MPAQLARRIQAIVPVKLVLAAVEKIKRRRRS